MSSRHAYLVIQFFSSLKWPDPHTHQISHVPNWVLHGINAVAFIVNTHAQLPIWMAQTKEKDRVLGLIPISQDAKSPQQVVLIGGPLFNTSWAELLLFNKSRWGEPQNRGCMYIYIHTHTYMCVCADWTFK